MRTSSHKKSLRLEPLEPRHLMASDWQNAVLHCDVDASSFVEPLDALIVINALNEGGERTLPTRPSGSSAPQVDVNGDLRLEVADVHMILGALNKYNQPLTVAANISVNSDPIKRRDLARVGRVDRLYTRGHEYRSDLAGAKQLDPNHGRGQRFWTIQLFDPSPCRPSYRSSY